MMQLDDISIVFETVVCSVFNQNILLLLLALQPTMGFSLLSDFLPFRPFFAQFPPTSLRSVP